MTDTLLDYDPNDTGDIPVGETTRIITPADRERLLGEETRNLAPEMAGLPPRRRPAADETREIRLVEPPLGLTHHNMHRVIEPDDTVIYLPTPAGFEGPQKPPPPLPPIPDKQGPETGVNIFNGLGADLPEEAFPGYVGRHRHPEDLDAAVGRYWEMQRPAHERRLSPWVLVGLAVVGLAIWAGLTLAAKVVFW